MNYIKHLNGFFDRLVEDRSLNPTHISLYIALFQFWNINRFLNPISITRDEVMRISKISSKATYHRCLQDLNHKGYVKYEPSFNPFKGSMVFLLDFSENLQLVQKTARSPKKISPNSKLVMNKHRTGSETSSEPSNEQALVSSINITNNSNNSNLSNFENLGEQSQNFQKEDDFLKDDTIEEKEKSSAKKEKENYPTIEDVHSYFLEQQFPELEAHKFFNYFSSVGWLVGGKTPMVDWQAAAQNWMLNAIQFKSHEKPTDRAQHLNVGNDKNYSEPF